MFVPYYFKIGGVELPLFFVFLGLHIGDSVNINFVIFRTCDVILGYNQTDCEKLGSGNKNNFTTELEKLTQPTADVILATINLFSQIIPVIYCLFIGPWSDKNGRKKILLITVFGAFILFMIKVVISLIPSASPWFLILECVPIILTGGTSTCFMISLCYITDITSVENRGIRMAIFECLICIGILIGTISSSYLLNALGYTVVFLLGAASQLIALILLCFIKETIADTSKLKIDSSIFSTVHIKELFNTTIKKRDKNGRLVLFLLISSLGLFVLAIGNRNCFFLYLRTKFEFTLEKYTIYSSIRITVWILGTFMGVYIMQKLLKIPEIVILLIGIIMMGFSASIEAVAITTWHLWIAVGIASMGGVIAPMVRSLITKEIPADEIGKIFSVTLALELFGLLLGGPISTAIYNSTITTFPGMFNLFGSAIYVIGTIFVVIIMILRKRSVLPAKVPNELMVINDRRKY